MKTVYNTKGTCSKHIAVEVEDEIIKEVGFHGGCEGNLKGVASLVKGMRVDEAIQRLDGITCGRKSTSCPDQLVKALKSLT